MTRSPHKAIQRKQPTPMILSSHNRCENMKASNFLPFKSGETPEMSLKE